MDFLKALGVTLCFLSLLEVGLRAAGVHFAASFFTPDRILGFAMRPNAQGWYTEEGENYVKLNRAGLYDTDHAETKPPSTVRIAFVGSSYPEAIQVALNETVGRVIQNRLSERLSKSGTRAEVLSFGVAGYTVAQTYLQLDTLVWKYHPDLILLGFDTISGVLNSNRSTSIVGNQTPYYEIVGQKLELDTQSRESSSHFDARAAMLHNLFGDVSNRIGLLTLGNTARVSLRDKLRTAGSKQSNNLPVDYATTFSYEPPRNPAMQTAWRITEALILAIQKSAEDRKVPFWLVIQDTPQQTTPRLADREAFRKRLNVPSLYYSNTRLADFAGQHAIPYASLAPILADYSALTGTSLHGVRGGVLNGGHWNQAGNALAGRIVADALFQREPSLRRRE